MKVNTSMSKRLLRIKPRLGEACLNEKLAELLSGPLVNVGGAIVLEEFSKVAFGWPCPDDLTGFEAYVNKIHLADYVKGCSLDDMLVQGVIFAQSLAMRLSTLGLPFRIFVNIDPESEEVTVRFFMRRVDNPWAVEDLEEYQFDEVAQLDIG